jgi:hypothetical protein
VKGKLNNDGQQFHKYQAIEHKKVHVALRVSDEGFYQRASNRCIIIGTG